MDKTKILSLAVIAGLFAGCESQNPLLKDIKTDEKGCYIPVSKEDCDNLIKAGVITKEFEEETKKCENTMLANKMSSLYAGKITLKVGKCKE